MTTTPQDSTARPTPVLVVRDALVLQGPACRVLAKALDRLVSLEQRLNGVAPGGLLTELRTAAHSAAGLPDRTAADLSGHADVRTTPDPAAWLMGHDGPVFGGTEEWISSHEAGEHLGVTDRHIRRLADDGHLGKVRRTRGRLLIHSLNLELFKAEREGRTA